MDAWVAPTLIHLRQTGGVIVALWAQAGEAVDSIDASTSVVTRVYGTVIDVDVTHCTWETKETVFCTLSPILKY